MKIRGGVRYNREFFRWFLAFAGAHLVLAVMIPLQFGPGTTWVAPAIYFPATTWLALYLYFFNRELKRRGKGRQYLRVWIVFVLALLLVALAAYLANITVGPDLAWFLFFWLPSLLIWALLQTAKVLVESNIWPPLTRLMAPVSKRTNVAA